MVVSSLVSARFRKEKKHRLRWGGERESGPSRSSTTNIPLILPELLSSRWHTRDRSTLVGVACGLQVCGSTRSFRGVGKGKSEREKEDRY